MIIYNRVAVQGHIRVGILNLMYAGRISEKHALTLLKIAEYGQPVYQKFNNGNVWFLGRNTAYKIAREMGVYHE